VPKDTVELLGGAWRDLTWMGRSTLFPALVAATVIFLPVMFAARLFVEVHDALCSRYPILGKRVGCIGDLFFRS